MSDVEALTDHADKVTGSFIVNGCDIKRIARMVDQGQDDSAPEPERDIAERAAKLLAKMRQQGYIESHQRAHVMRFITNEAAKVTPAESGVIG
jgi:hypothetical protein